MAGKEMFDVSLQPALQAGNGHRDMVRTPVPVPQAFDGRNGPAERPV